MIVCPRCGKLNQPAAARCEGCGQALSTPVTLPTEAMGGAAVPSPGPFGRPSAPLSGPPPVPQPAVADANRFAQPVFGLGSLANSTGAAASQLPQPSAYCFLCGQLILPTAAIRPCPRCQAPLGYVADPNDFTCSTVTPYTGKPIPLTTVNPLLVLTGTESQDYAYNVPGWNWGAALCSTLWTLRHRCWGWAAACLANLLFWAVIAVLLPGAVSDSQSISNPDAGVQTVVNLIIPIAAAFWLYKTIYLGVHGNTLALKYGRYSGEAQMLSAQIKWNKIGGIVGGLANALVLVEFIWLVLH